MEAGGFMLISPAWHKAQMRNTFMPFITILCLMLLSSCGRNERNTVSISFPLYNDELITELKYGHHVSYFDRTDTLYSFLDKYNAGDYGDYPLAFFEEGYGYHVELVEQDGGIYVYEVECQIGNDLIYVYMKSFSEDELIGLWEVYQIDISS